MTDSWGGTSWGTADPAFSPGLSTTGNLSIFSRPDRDPEPQAQRVPVRRPLSDGRGPRTTQALPIGLDDIFFSTTDRRGVIITGNAVFSRISEYRPEELVGSPHNIIRHPAMPAGVFALMWDRLLAGLPMAGYVLNLSKTGKGYWVFATITPHGDGFLSVRTTPQSASFGAALQLYEEVWNEENRARADGASAPAAARLGARLILEGLARLGIASYDDFMAQVLPAEVAARAPHAAHRISRLLASVGPGAGSGSDAAAEPVAAVLVAAARLDGALGQLVGRLDGYRELILRLQTVAEMLGRAASGVIEAVDAARATARLVEESAGSQAELGYSVAPANAGKKSPPGRVLRNVAETMVAPAQGVSASLQTLADVARAGSESVSALRVDISLARLHTEMATLFAGDVLSGEPASAVRDIPELCDALHRGLNQVGVGLDVVNARLDAAAGAAKDLAEQFNEFRRLVGMWRFLAIRHQVGTQITEAVRPLDEMLDASHAHLDALIALAAQSRAAILPTDASGFDVPACDRWQLSIREAATRLGASRGA